MTDDECKARARYARKNRSEAREKGICARCGAKFEPNGHTVCPRCRKALNELLAIVRGRR